MFNLGLPEMLVIGAMVLLVFGPKRLPELAKGVGKGIRDFKKALEGNEDKVLPPEEKQAELKSPENEKDKDTIPKA